MRRDGGVKRVTGEEAAATVKTTIAATEAKESGTRLFGPRVRSERYKIDMKLLNSARQPNQSFVSVMLAFSLFGLLWRHDANLAGSRLRLNFIQKNRVQQNDDWSDGWAVPPRSPGFHEDFGS